ncbi:Multiple RNA-binding domain-containing protein 1 [Coemansia sp. RSA 552]|nr:Multiple RNA-binding domain-containing protein 1 [Coemansia sp. RSA 552]
MSSRVIVKNLPKHINERQFREHFAAKGEITDVKLIYTAKGQFRRFGYIGYRTEEEAQQVQSYFHRSFINTSRIEVEIARPQGDASLPRAWSVHTKGTTLYNKVHGIKGTRKQQREREEEDRKQKEKTQRAIRTLYDELLADNVDDPRFKEFLQVMAPRAKNRAWTNDDYANWQTGELAAINGAVNARRQQVESEKTEVPSVKDDDEGSNDSDEESVGSQDAEDSEEPSADADAGTTGGPVADKKDPGEAKPSDADPMQTVASAITQIEETGRLFVRNLPYMATEDELRKVFEPFGPLSEVHMPISKDTKRPKGFAYVLYLMPEHAVKAYKALDNKVFLGRLLHVLPGKEKPQAREAEDDSMGGFKSSLQKERDAKKKALAGSDFNWNTLFMSADAVADSISERLSISKADLLSADSSGNPAVRLALAETHIVNDAKQFFEDHGVSLDRFGDRERSDVVILVKNIPFSIDENELRSLFGKHGSLGRVLLPPSRTIAIVEFLEPSEARAAFRHLAYKRLKDAPIYLERAPKDVFDTAFDPSAHGASKEAGEYGGKADSKAQVAKLLEPVNPSASRGEGEAGCVLFVKNLSFDTTEDTLRQIFGGVDGLASTTIRRKKDPKNEGKFQSMGFGFIEYSSSAAAQQALGSFQGVEVDGHSLVLKMSDRLGRSGAAAEDDDGAAAGGMKKPKSTKLVVKNVPFEATRKDIRDLVSSFGQVKSVRLPKKFSGGHRGFAFVEFLTPQEAQHVLDTMKSTHLYGRHLVLGWAEEENSLDAIREKVGRQFAKDNAGSGAPKRRKIEMDEKNQDDDGLEMDMD